ncbi:MAG: hypothetical protein PHQ98_02680 [Candidatus ainarchaeum sp.]|nr:hypothetical protein [Candidatus ainarchaeum sp.]
MTLDINQFNKKNKMTDEQLKKTFSKESDSFLDNIKLQGEEFESAKKAYYDFKEKEEEES